jgi:hypothetical protein
MVQEQLSPPAELDSADAALAVAQSRLQRARDEARTQVAEVLQRRIELQQAEKRLADASCAPHGPAGLLRATPAPVRCWPPERRCSPCCARSTAPAAAGAGAAGRAVAVGQRVDFTVDGRQPGREPQQGLGGTALSCGSAPTSIAAMARCWSKLQ